MKRHPTPSSQASFSLIEILLSLGIMSFALLSVMGLLTLGLKTNKESSDQIAAAHLASLLVSMRRAQPNNTAGAMEDFPIPSLTNGTTTICSNAQPIVVGIGGSTNTSGLAANEIYNLQYVIYPGSATNVVNLHLVLWWPIQLQSPPIKNSGGYYEIATQISF